MDLPGSQASGRALTPRGLPIWFALPVGFFPVDLTGGGTSAEGLAWRFGDRSDAAGREFVDVTLARHAALVDKLVQAGVTFFANGIHPVDEHDEAAGVTLSAMSLTVRAVPATHPGILLAAMGRAAEAAPAVLDVSIREFLAGSAVVAEYERELPEIAGPGMPADSDHTVTLRQVQVGFPGPKGDHVAIFDLTTKALDHWDAYRTLMLNLVAPSVTFSRPEADDVSDMPDDDRVGRIIRGEL